MSGLGFNNTLYAQQEALRLKAAQQEADKAQPTEEQFIAEMHRMKYFFESDLKKALKRKYGNTALPRFIKLKPFVVDGDKDLHTSVIDTNTWEIYYPAPSNPNQYIKKLNAGFYNHNPYIMDLYYNLNKKMEEAPDLAILAGGRRRYKRAQNKSKSSKKRINKNKRRTRSRK